MAGRLLCAALFCLNTMTAASRTTAGSVVERGEAQARHGETAASLLTLNRYIDDAATRQLHHADSALLLRALHQNAQNYQTLGNAHQSLAYFRRAIAIARSLGDKHRLAILCNNVFGIYYAQGEYEQAEDLLRQSLAINEQFHDSAAIRNNYNNLGLVGIDRRQFGKALTFFRLALRYTPDSDPVGRSLILTNLADLYDRQGLYAQAERHLAEAMSLQRGHPMDSHTVQTSLNLALLKALRGKTAEAQRLQPAIYAALPHLPLATQANSLAQLADIHFALGDSLAALRDILRYQTLADSLRRATNTSQLQQLLVAYDTERLRQTNDALQQAVGHRTAAIYGTVAFLLVLLVLVVFLVRRMRIDKQKSRLISEQQQRLLQYEQAEHERKQRELSTEIAHKNRQLTTYTLDLASINEFHQHIASDLATLRGTTKEAEADSVLRDLIHRLEHFNDKPLGDDFRLYFDEVHPGFLQQLSDRYHLGKTDLRLCAYLRLGMTTKEIAALTYKEVRSVESQRNRLRKKLGLEPGCDLLEFLMQQKPNN